MFACRKLYAETHILPFQLSIFDLSGVTSFDILTELLVGSPRAQAISNIQMNFWWLYVQMFDVCHNPLPLNAFTGLKRVEIRNSPGISALEADIISEIHRVCTRSNIEVVFKGEAYHVVRTRAPVTCPHAFHRN
jgi:hypothetical protein